MIPFAIIGKFLKALMGSKTFQYVMAAFLAMSGIKVWLLTHDRKIEKAAVEKIDTQARKKTVEAVKAREPAFQPGSAERLKQRFCRDC